MSSALPFSVPAMPSAPTDFAFGPAMPASCSSGAGLSAVRLSAVSICGVAEMPVTLPFSVPLPPMPAIDSTTS